MMLTNYRRHRAGFPTPTSGTQHAPPIYGGSGIIHPSVVDMGVKWNGYRWWRADTPYAEEFENPCIWGSNDRVTWEVPAGLTNPIDPWPGALKGDAAWYNSDTEMVWDSEGQRLVVYWREVKPNAAVKWWTASSRDGVTWVHHGQRFSAGKSNAIVSDPAGGWRMLTFGPCSIYTAPDVLGPWTISPTPLTGLTDPSGTVPYHGDMILYKGVWCSMWSASVPDIWIAASVDGYAWNVRQTRASTGYRPTLCAAPEPGYLDMWQSQVSIYLRFPESYWLDLIP